MIDLSPTRIKQFRRFARFNLFASRQILAIIIIGSVSIWLIFNGGSSTERRESLLRDEINTNQAIYDGLRQYEDQAKDLNSQIKAIEALLERRVTLSQLLVDIASALPETSSLSSINLSGEPSQPLNLLISVPSQADAAVLRATLVQSGIFSQADIQSVTPVGSTDGQTTYEAAIRVMLVSDVNQDADDTAANQPEPTQPSTTGSGGSVL